MNESLQIILAALAAVASDPALGYRGASISAALRLASVAVAKGEAGFEALQQLAATVKDYNVDTKKGLLGDLKARSDAAHDILNPPPPPEESADEEAPITP